VLAIDTDVARTNEVQRSASGTRCERRSGEEGVPPVPMRDELGEKAGSEYTRRASFREPRVRGRDRVKE
jgi:hypothetical protein